MMRCRYVTETSFYSIEYTLRVNVHNVLYLSWSVFLARACGELIRYRVVFWHRRSRAKSAEWFAKRSWWYTRTQHTFSNPRMHTHAHLCPNIPESCSLRSLPVLNRRGSHVAHPSRLRRAGWHDAADASAGPLRHFIARNPTTPSRHDDPQTVNVWG